MQCKCHPPCLYLVVTLQPIGFTELEILKFVSHVQKGLIYYTLAARRHV